MKLPSKWLTTLAMAVLLWSGSSVASGQIFVTTGGDAKLKEYTTSCTLINPALITGLAQPEFMAISGSDLYIVNRSTASIGLYTTSGAVVNPSLITGLNDPLAMAVSGTKLLVATGGDGKLKE